jgi:hypothetical protein
MKKYSIIQDALGDNPSGLYVVHEDGKPIAHFDFKKEAQSFVRYIKSNTAFAESLSKNNGTKI